MEKKEAIQYYKDKLFYEVIQMDLGEFKLYGPVANLYKKEDGSGYVQVIEGNIVANFNNDEIHETTYPLIGTINKRNKLWLQVKKHNPLM